VYAFGLNENGQLGLGHQRNENVPKRLETTQFEGQKIKGIACGAYHSLVIVGTYRNYSNQCPCIFLMCF
jgi:alpha-tubulin suppressor-like RCC1 family protein